MRSRVLNQRMRERVLVSLKSGDSFLGVLWDADSKALVLRNAEAIGVREDKSNAPVDGELLILFGDVAFVQRP